MKPRITTSDIARAAGVHQTTVSLALRNDGRLKPATIARIKAMAAKLGYTPDPMLAALAAYRRTRRTMRHEEGPTAIGIRRWLKANRPDVVFGCAEPLKASLESAKEDQGKPVDFVLIGLADPTINCPVMHEAPQTVGATAVERLTSLIHIGERGIPTIASRTLIDATWIDARPES